jgi:hypothetical protein
METSLILSLLTVLLFGFMKILRPAGKMMQKHADVLNSRSETKSILQRLIVDPGVSN